MSGYKLTYFNFRGRAESSRYLFALANIPYIDERIDHYGDDVWEKMKSSFLWQKLPQLVVNDVIIVQSRAICRYLAEEFGFMGNTNLEKARINMLMDCVDDMAEPVIQITYYEKEEERKAILKARHDKVLTQQLETMNSFLCQNEGGNGWFVGKNVTLADIYIYNNSDFFLAAYPTALDKYPKMKEHRERFEQLPQIKVWMAKRPVTAV